MALSRRGCPSGKPQAERKLEMAPGVGKSKSCPFSLGRSVSECLEILLNYRPCMSQNLGGSESDGGQCRADLPRGSAGLADTPGRRRFRAAASHPEDPHRRQGSGLAPARRAAFAPCPTVRQLDIAKACRSGRADGNAGWESQQCDRSGARAGDSPAAPLLDLTRAETFFREINLDRNSRVCIHKCLIIRAITRISRGCCYARTAAE